MTREQKLALIIGFALVLLVGVAVSDHFSQARVAQLETGFVATGDWSDEMAIKLPPIGSELAKPIQTLAATPEKQSSASFGVIGEGLGKGIDPPRSLNAVDWIDRFRNQLSELPRAAETTPVVAYRPTQKVQSSSRTTVRWRSVRAGDTLWSIAKEQYGDGSLAGKLAAFNNTSASDPDLLRIGVRLRIPPEHVLRGKPALSKPKQIQRSQIKTLAPVTRLYTIKPGDTLGEIAMEQLGTIKRLNEIIALNPKALSDPNMVPVGATIRLPAK